MLRGFPDSISGQAMLDRSWSAIRALQIRLDAHDMREGHFVNHVVALNLGPDASLDTNFENRGWRTDVIPHHGIGLFPATVPHAARGHHSRDYLFVEVAPESVAAVLGSTGDAAPLRPRIGLRDTLAQHILLAVAEEARLGAPSGELRAARLVDALVSRLAERVLADPDTADRTLGARAASSAPLPSAKLRRVLDYVMLNLEAPLTLPLLAGLAEMDVFRFIRSFKQVTGLSPHRYILEARIARAKELLRDPALTITEVALQTGFATPSHFSVTFRRVASVTPREYREALR